MCSGEPRCVAYGDSWSSQDCEGGLSDVVMLFEMTLTSPEAALCFRSICGDIHVRGSLRDTLRPLYATTHVWLVSSGGGVDYVQCKC